MQQKARTAQAMYKLKFRGENAVLSDGKKALKVVKMAATLFYKR